MAEVFPVALIERLEKSRVVAGFSVEQAKHAVPLAKALLSGGIDVIELTLRSAAGMDAIREICVGVPEVLVGVGTILTPEQAVEVKSAGAAFGVAPGFNSNVVRAAIDAGLPFGPGVATPSELEAAIELGCRFVKFFPAEPSGGVSYLRSLSAPYAHLGIKYFPLGGVNAGNMMKYLDEPQVIAVGGTWIVESQMVKDEDWSGITDRAADVCRVLSGT